MNKNKNYLFIGNFGKHGLLVEAEQSSINKSSYMLNFGSDKDLGGFLSTGDIIKTMASIGYKLIGEI